MTRGSLGLSTAAAVESERDTSEGGRCGWRMGPWWQRLREGERRRGAARPERVPSGYGPRLGRAGEEEVGRAEENWEREGAGLAGRRPKEAGPVGSGASSRPGQRAGRLGQIEGKRERGFLFLFYFFSFLISNPIQIWTYANSNIISNLFFISK